MRETHAAVSTARILIVDDEAPLMYALTNTLKIYGFDCVGVTTGTEALDVLRDQKFELMLSDLSMPDMSGIELLQAALQIDPDLVGIIMTGQGTVTTAVDAMKSGALDYILKPFRVSVVLPVLSRALAVRRLRLENVALQQRVADRTAELEEANNELEAFCYSVSHDLHAPLRAINGVSSILLEDFATAMPAKASDLVNRIAANATRMGHLIDDLLRLSQLGRQPLSVHPVSTAAMVREILDELNKENAGRSVETVVGDLPDCMGDAGLLRQMFFNLLSNAFKFTRQTVRPTLMVGSEERDGQCVYFVKDNGAGFDMRYAQRLFGVFQRMHRADQFEGTGIGLSIVHRVIRRHGGRVWAESALDQGTTFFFTIPAPTASRGE
ncbi:MAG: ATP-binding protein [bacterium]